MIASFDVGKYRGLRAHMRLTDERGCWAWVGHTDDGREIAVQPISMFVDIEPPKRTAWQRFAALRYGVHPVTLALLCLCPAVVAICYALRSL